MIAPASLAFVGNLDDAIPFLVSCRKHDLFKPLPEQFDLAVIHRFHHYLPGWEIPANSSSLLTDEYGFITDYLAEALHFLFKHRNFFTALTIEDPYIRRDDQLRNLIHVCELAVEKATIKRIELVTASENESQRQAIEPKFKQLAESLADAGTEFVFRFDDKIEDREMRTDTGWHIRIGRGLHIYQQTDSWIQIGANNLDLRPCMETKVSISRDSLVEARSP